MKTGFPSYHAIFSTIETGNVDLCLSLIDSNPALLNIADSNINTPLLLALEQNQLKLAAQLIRRGANLFAMNHSDRWPMKLIVRKKKGLKAAHRKQLVDASIDANACDIEIFHAVWRRDRKQATAILQEYPDQASVRLALPDGPKGFYNTQPYCGCTPLHYAVLAGDKRMVRLLLEAGAEVDAVPHGYKHDAYHTPMMQVPGGCGEIAQMLIDFGANPCHSATYLIDGSQAVRDVVIANGATGSPLMTALYLRNFEEAIAIARDDASVIHDRLPGSPSGTPLHLAARVGCPEVIDLLVKHGMDIDTPGPDDGDTVLAQAPEMYCSFEIIQQLVELGADIHVDDDKPLSYAVWQHAFGHWDYEQVIRLLVSCGSQPRGLHFCAQAGNVAAAKLLIELGADVNDPRDNDWPGENRGCTPLDYCTGVAGKSKHDQLAELLRAHGGKPSADLD